MGSEVKVILSGLITQSRISDIVKSHYRTDKVIEDNNDGYISFRMRERTRIMNILHHCNYKEYADWLEPWVEKSEKELELRNVLKGDYTVLSMNSDCYSIGLMKHILYILGGWIDYDDCDDSGFEYFSNDENDDEDEYFPKRSKRIEVDAAGYVKEDDREIVEAVDKASKCLVESIVFDIGKEYNINDLRLLILDTIYDKLNNALVNGGLKMRVDTGCELSGKNTPVEDEVFIISKHDLIDILTKSGIFNFNGIEVVLSRDGLKGVLSGMMVTTDTFRSRADHYKDECSMLRNSIHELESLVDRYEDIFKSESDR